MRRKILCQLLYDTPDLISTIFFICRRCVAYIGNKGLSKRWGRNIEIGGQNILSYHIFLYIYRIMFKEHGDMVHYQVPVAL